MLDNGFPLSVELNVLKEMVRPPNFVTDILDPSKKRVKDTLPTGQLSATQWRRTGVKYVNNEIFVDFIETMDVIVDRSGATISCEVNGTIAVKCRLSGNPDLVLSLVHPRVLDEVSFHPCVRLLQWSTERVMSFVPPDGNFVLCNYTVNTGTIQLPVYIKPLFTFDKSGGKFDVEVLVKSSVGKQVEDLSITIPFPKSINNVKVTSTSFGVWNYDQLKRVLKWDFKKVLLDKTHVIRGQTSFAPGCTTSEAPTLSANFTITGYAASSVKVNRLDIYGEKYKPFKGVKYVTKAGDYQVRA